MSAGERVGRNDKISDTQKEGVKKSETKETARDTKKEGEVLRTK